MTAIAISALLSPVCDLYTFIPWSHRLEHPVDNFLSWYFVSCRLFQIRPFKFKSAFFHEIFATLSGGALLRPHHCLEEPRSIVFRFGTATRMYSLESIDPGIVVSFTCEQLDIDIAVVCTFCMVQSSLYRVSLVTNDFYTRSMPSWGHCVASALDAVPRIRARISIVPLVRVQGMSVSFLTV